jgi:hypothetical protein
MCIVVVKDVEEVDGCHLIKRVVFGFHHESNTSNHFNCPSSVHPVTAFMVPLSVHVSQLTHLPTGFQLLYTVQ